MTRIIVVQFKTRRVWGQDIGTLNSVFPSAWDVVWVAGSAADCFAAGQDWRLSRHAVLPDVSGAPARAQASAASRPAGSDGASPCLGRVQRCCARCCVSRHAWEERAPDVRAQYLRPGGAEK